MEPMILDPQTNHEFARLLLAYHRALFRGKREKRQALKALHAFVAQSFEEHLRTHAEDTP